MSREQSLVARTLRQVETTQNMIRIVGLSATLPNYIVCYIAARLVIDLGWIVVRKNRCLELH